MIGSIMLSRNNSVGALKEKARTCGPFSFSLLSLKLLWSNALDWMRAIGRSRDTGWLAARGEGTVQHSYQYACCGSSLNPVTELSRKFAVYTYRP